MLNPVPSSNIQLQFFLAAGINCARRTFAKLDMHWDGDELGMNRPTMTDRETEGLDIIKNEAEALDMQGYELLSGSRLFIYQGTDPSLPPDIIGSHIDSVRKGGRYDGPAGIVAGLAAVATIHQRYLETGIKPKRTIVVLADRGEESVEYNQFGISSGINAGKFGPDVLNLRSTSNQKTYEDNARAQGIDVDALRQKLQNREDLIPFELLGKQWEVHIEQGKKLASSDVSLGIVSGFRGNVRYAGTVHFKGRADHTGATEMPDRLDAGDAFIEFRAQVKREAEALRSAGHDLVYTFHFKTDDDRTSIPENAYSAVEARSTSPETLKQFEAIVEAAIQNVRTLGYEVNANHDKMKRTAPVSLDGDAQNILRKTADEIGVSHVDMASGAGHDLMNYAPKVSAGFVLFGHGNGGLSHNPGEMLGLTPEQDPFAEGNYPKVIELMANVLTRDERGYAEPQSVSPKNVSRDDFVTELKKRGAKPIGLVA